MLVNRRRIGEYDPFEDLSGDQSVQRVDNGGFFGEGLEGGFLAAEIAQEVVNFLVGAQAVAQAGPAGTLPVCVKDGAEQRLHAPGTHEHPGLAAFEPAPIHLRETFFEIVAADDDAQFGIFASRASAAFLEPPCQAAVVIDNFDTGFRQPLLDPARRSAER